MPVFSVILATRNRPSLFKRALDSVVEQTCGSIEVIVVNDGSDQHYLAEYDAITASVNRPKHMYQLIARPNGHGQSYSINVGAAAAQGDYLCFLDDDDLWIDHDYLLRAQRALAELKNEPDLLFSCQEAFSKERREDGPLWLESLAARLAASRQADICGFYQVGVDELLRSGGFCHMNTMIVRRKLFEEIRGMDEGIRWECDHDLFLRLIDRAKTMLLSPSFVARHNIPDPAGTSSMTTSLSGIERRLFQLRVFDKAALFSKRREIKDHGRQHKAFALKRITELLSAIGEFKGAAFYAREALGAAPTLRWSIYSCYLGLKASVRRPKDE